MITTDGDRSKKRLWFAKKQIEALRHADVPMKTSRLDGFLVSAWQVDELQGGHIKAPAGAIFLCSTQQGIKIAMMENWLGSCVEYSDYYYLFNPGFIASVYNSSSEDLAAAGFQTLSFRPVISSAYCELPSGATSTVNAYSCTPAVMPYNTGEAVNITITDDAFIDLNGDGLPDYPYPVTDSSLVDYASNGSNLGGRRTASLASGADDMRKTCINLLGGMQLLFAESFFDLNLNQFVCAETISEVTDSVSGLKYYDIEQIYLSDMVPEGAGMPDVLRGYMLNTTISIIRPMGSYAFINSTGSLVVIVAALFSPSAVPIGGANTTILDYFTANPTQAKWQMFLSVMVNGEATLIDSSQFMTMLQSLAVNSFYSGSVLNWDLAGIMMQYILPYPNLPGLIEIYFAWKPHDSVMFFAEDDAAYSWTRTGGGVKFDTDGLALTSLTMPEVVTDNVGVRPDITYAGNGIYVCVCNDLGVSIPAVYVGSPFTAWGRLPDPPEYCTLMHVRPIVADTEKLYLLGIVLYDDPSTGQVYRSAFLNYTYTAGAWEILGTLPFDVGTADNFAASLYGDDALVKFLNTYPSPPPAVPQNIVVPYDGYTRWRP